MEVLSSDKKVIYFMTQFNGSLGKAVKWDRKSVDFRGTIQ